jgi:uncharacterized protein
MTLAIVPLDPLDRGQLQVMRLRGVLVALPALLVAGAVDWLALPRLREELFGLPPFGLVPLLVLLAGLWLVLGAGRRWRHWGYAFTGGELHVARGWLTRVHTIVPVLRVQHIDVTQGPIERMFGVSQLVLHTAGTDNSMVALPGIARATAEEIRDAIRARIGSAE